MRFVKGGNTVFESSAVGIAGVLLAILGHGSDLEGCACRADHVGKVMGRLLVFARVTSVEARTVTSEALTMLAAASICVNSQIVLPSQFTDVAPAGYLSELSSADGDTSTFILHLKGRLLGLLSYNLAPTDELLAKDLPMRLGFSAGGT